MMGCACICYKTRETYHDLKHAQQTRDAIVPGFKSSQLTVETVQELIDLIDGVLLQELDNVAEGS